MLGNAPTAAATIARAGSLGPPRSHLQYKEQRTGLRVVAPSGMMGRGKKVEPILTSLNLLQKQTEKMMSLFSLPSASQRT